MTHPDIERVLLDPEAIRARVRELAAQLSGDYAGKKPVLIGILKGSVPFLADLMQAMTEDHTVDFMGASSYSGEASSGVVRPWTSRSAAGTCSWSRTSSTRA